MPGISAWCELQETKTKTITPIEVALEGVKKKNSDIKNVTQKYRYTGIRVRVVKCDAFYI